MGSEQAGLHWRGRRESSFLPSRKGVLIEGRGVLLWRGTLRRKTQEKIYANGVEIGGNRFDYR